MTEIKYGKIGWIDLTVPDAGALRDFYQAVVGWETMEFDMGGYQDYCMLPPGSDDAVAGICHARGANATMPAQWMIYITVADLETSLAAATSGGGTIVVAPRNAGGGSFAAVRDPAGAVFGLFQANAKEEN